MLVAYPVARKLKSRNLCEAFIQGADASEDAAVFYGVDDSNMEHWNRVRAEGRDYYYLDNSFFDPYRGRYFRVAKNAMQIDGSGHTTGARFRMLNMRVRPWRTAGEHVVVCPPSDHFLRLVGRPDWLHETLDELRRMTLRPFRVRQWQRDKSVASMTLLEDLKGAHALVTYSSAAAVTALLHGIPIVSESGACALMGSSLEMVEHPILPPDRGRFFGVLADNEFTIDELRNGTAWRMLH